MSQRILLVSIVLAGCGGTVDPNSPGATSACYAQCDAQSRATNCPDTTLSDSDCRKLCDEIVSHLGGDCLLKAKAAWSCGASASWACSGSDDIPVEGGNTCDAQNAAYQGCLTNDGGAL